MKSMWWAFCVGVMGGVAWSNSAAAQEAVPAVLDPESQTLLLNPADSGEMGQGGQGIFRPWGGVQYQTGPGIGYRTGYTTLEGFVPAYLENVGVVFGDARLIEGDSERFSANVGGGYRYYSPAWDRIFGVNGYFDDRDTGEHTFHQGGIGFEALGSAWDFRANAYLPTSGGARNSAPVFSDPTFFEHFILLGRTSSGEAELGGFDAEVGAPLPHLAQYGIKAYVGTYNFQGSGGPQAWGAKGRVEARITDAIDANLTVGNDRVYGTTVTFNVGIRFGAREARNGSSRGDTFARLADRVERNEMIVVRDNSSTATVKAIDPATGQPFIVEHVASYAAPGGDGTVEHPFQTLAQLQAGSGPNDILFAHANSVFGGQSITLQDNQRFLGEGISHYFTATQGTFLLPRATSGTDIPQINDSFGNAVTLANNDEVSGFNIARAIQISSNIDTGNGIFGSGVTGFDLNRNTITGSNTHGIFLTSIDGGGSITGNTLTGNDNNGLVISASNYAGPITGNNISSNSNFGVVLTAASFTGDLSGNTIQSNGNTGVDATITGALTGNVSGNNFSNNHNFGLNLSAGSINGSITNNTASTDDNTGLNVAVSGALNGSVSDNTTNSNANFGINLSAGSITGSLSNNTSSNNSNDGILLSDSGAFNGNVSGNTTLTNQVNGINFSAGSLTGSISGNTATGNKGNNGLNFAIGGAAVGDISNNITSNNQVTGINFSAGSYSGNVTSNTASNNVGKDGIDFDVSGAVTGSFSGNTTNGNHVTGINFSAGSYSGNVSNNTANNNVGNDGIQFSVSGAATGNFSSNTTNGNHTNGIEFSSGVFTGNFTNNQANSSSGNEGILITANNFNGNLLNNTTTMNFDRGTFITLNGSSGTSTIGVLNNDFHNNSTGDSQFQLNNTAAGTATVTLSGNVAALPPPISTGPGNFTFNSSGGLITVQQSSNTGGIQAIGNVSVSP